jgi:hypothetical protein
LCVILGPLAASVDCAKKSNVAVRISNAEIMIRWKPAMLSNISRSNKLSRVRDQGRLAWKGKAEGPRLEFHVADSES